MVQLKIRRSIFRQVTLTEKTSIFQTLTQLVTTTLFFDRTLTTTQTVLTGMTSRCAQHMNGVDKLPIEMKEDDELVRNLLLSPTTIQTSVFSIEYFVNIF